MTTSNGPVGNTPAGNLPPIKFADLAAALLSRSEQLLPAWLTGGKRNGHEWVCGSLAGEEGSSLSINIHSGMWSDFATGEKGGDLVSLYAAIHGLTMGKAALSVARDEGLEDVAGVQRSDAHQRIERPEPPPVKSKPPQIEEGWQTVRPVPAYAPKTDFKHFSRSAKDILRVSAYRVGDDLHGYVVRFQKSDGGKDDLPHTFCMSARNGAARWHWKQFDEPRPLYLPSYAMPNGRTVVLVEGEKKAEVLQKLLDANAPNVYCVASWSGGCKAWQKSDWSWLAGCSVLAWPDCDSKRVKPALKKLNACADEAAREALKLAQPYIPAAKQPGMSAMLGIGQVLVAEHGCTVQLLAIDAPGVKPDGWDATDAIEIDGWDFDRVMAFFATAYALPSESGEVAAAAPAAIENADSEKKFDGPSSLEAHDEGGGKPSRAVSVPWWLKPYFDAEKNRWNISRKTVITAFREDEDLYGVLGFNLLSNTMEARCDWPFEHGRKGKITGAIDLLLGNWLSRKYGLPAISRQALMEAMETVAYENPWHPVQEYFADLVWDGVSRIDKWLIHTIGETPETLPAETREYLQQVGRFWLLGIVNRVMEPGCKFDYCPVLEGPGGLGKSTMVEVLASSAWYADTPFEIGKGKESQEQVQGVVLYEMGELSQMGKAEITAVKAFITSKVDRYRPAYGRVIEEHPRQCVLVGTTNESTYLRDRTGNRRFWPVAVRKMVNRDWLAACRDQLFAEAYALYLTGAAYTPTREDEERLFVPMQDARLVETGVTSELLNVLTRELGEGQGSNSVNKLSKFVTLHELLKALGVDAGKSNAGLEAQIRSWMQNQGWENKKQQRNGVRQTGWHRPKDWLKSEAETPAKSDAPTAPVAEDADYEPF